MPPVRPLARTRNQMLDEGVAGFINWALDQRGKQRAWILAQMHWRFPNATRRSLESAYDHVIAARRSAREHERLKEGEHLKAGGLSSNPAIPQRYRYIVTISWMDQTSNETKYFYAVVDTARLLTKQELKEQAYNQTQAILPIAAQRDSKYNFTLPAITSVDVDVRTVEKRAS